MHIHGSIPNVQSADFYSIASSERAAEAQRAAETRKRLLKAAQGLAAEAGAETPEATALVGQWMDARHSQVLTGDEYQAAASGRDPELG